MKIKLLSSIFTLSLVASSAAIFSSCSTLNKNNKDVENESTSNNLQNDDEQTPTQPDNPIPEETIITFKARRPEDESKIQWIGATEVKAKVGRQFCSVYHPGAIRDGYNVKYWINSKNNEKLKDTDKIEKDMIVYPWFDNDVNIKDCVALGGLSESTVSIVPHGETRPHIWYSYNGINWEQYNYDAEKEEDKFLRIKSGQTVYFRGNNDSGFSKSENDYITFSVGGSTVLFGNAMTLLDDGIGTTRKIPNAYCFYKLFAGSSGIKCISSNFLPADQGLTDYCYAYMFDDCQAISTFPSTLLPALDLTATQTGQPAQFCYACMFKGCNAITEVPSTLLRATKLAPYCYYGMFSDCNGITQLVDPDDGHILPAKDLAEGCYNAMFANCHELVNVSSDFLVPWNEQELSNAKLAKLCYGDMFANCDKLKMGEFTTSYRLRLPITDLSKSPSNAAADRCYEEMFYGCTSITKAPDLPATTLSSGCYNRMFYNCAFDETGAPALNAPTLAESCYEYMFCNCDNLKKIPNLPALTAEKASYRGMFSKCDGLEDISNCVISATTLKDNACEYMFQYSDLVIPPQIKATTLAYRCCKHMFFKCLKLTTIPCLPATSYAQECYYEMFRWDGELKYAMTPTEGGATIALTSGDYNCCYMMFCECRNLNVESGSSAIRNQKLVTGIGGSKYMFQSTLNFPEYAQGGDIWGSWYVPKYNPS